MACDCLELADLDGRKTEILGNPTFIESYTRSQISREGGGDVNIQVGMYFYYQWTSRDPIWESYRNFRYNSISDGEKVAGDRTN